MLQFEYLNFKIVGSRGSIDVDQNGATSWDNVRLLTTQNGVTKVQTLIGGIEKMEEHLNNQLTHYQQQGWQAIQVERPEEKRPSRYRNHTIQCILKRSVKLDTSDRMNQLTPNNLHTIPSLALRYKYAN